jgi:type II secretory pathway component GspD/PulD (secretin)
MKTTKILTIAIIAGFTLQHLALSQTGADQTATTTNQSSTTGNETSGAAGAATATTTDTNAAATPAPAAGGVSSTPAAAGNTPAAAADTNAAAPTAAASGSAAPAAATTNAESAASTTNAPAAETTSTNMPVAEAAGTNAPAVSADTNAPSAEAAGTNAPSAETAAVELPKIEFQDVPITTAIDNLARAAGINYLLDPKVGFNQPGPNGQVTPEPTLTIHWQNITARQALMAVLDNYGLQLVENPRTKIDKITQKEPNALPSLVTRVIQLKYASTSNMVAAVSSALTDRRSRVVPDTRTSQMVVVATEAEQADVDTLVSQLDKPTRQVLIETRLVQLTSNPQTQKGIDWSGTLQAQNVSFGNGLISPASRTTSVLPGSTPASSTTTIISQPQASTQPGGFMLNTASGVTPNIGFLTADGVQAVLSFLNSSTEAQVVSTPRVVTLDNETATINVTRALPIFNVTASTANTTGGSQLTYSNVGTVLEVTPRISANDYIWLRVYPIVSSLFGKETQVVAGQINSADVFDTRSIITQVLIPNANTLVMGGLVQDNPKSDYTKVPVMGDIPLLGHLFRSENKSMEKDNLVIFITPTIVKDADYAPTSSDFLKSRPRLMKDPMDPSSTWDSAQPKGDWSNPLPPEEQNFGRNQTQYPPHEGGAVAP